MSLDDAIKKHVLKVLDETPSKLEASRVLKISIKTLRNYLHKWDLMRSKSERICRNAKSYVSITAEERDYFENMDRW